MTFGDENAVRTFLGVIFTTKCILRQQRHVTGLYDGKRLTFKLQTCMRSCELAAGVSFQTADELHVQCWSTTKLDVVILFWREAGYFNSRMTICPLL